MKPPDEVVTGKVARFASSAREIVRLVAAAAAASRSTLPVATEWPVTRKSRTSDTVWPDAGPAHRASDTTRAARAALLVVIFFVFEFNAVRCDRISRHDGAAHLDVVANGEVATAAFPVFGLSVGHDAAYADEEADVRTVPAAQQDQAL